MLLDNYRIFESKSLIKREREILVRLSEQIFLVLFIGARNEDTIHSPIMVLCPSTTSVVRLNSALLRHVMGKSGTRSEFILYKRVSKWNGFEFVEFERDG